MFEVGSYVIYRRNTWKITDRYFKEWSSEALYRLIRDKGDTGIVAVHIPESMLKECKE